MSNARMRICVRICTYSEHAFWLGDTQWGPCSQPDPGIPGQSDLDFPYSIHPSCRPTIFQRLWVEYRKNEQKREVEHPKSNER